MRWIARLLGGMIAFILVGWTIHFVFFIPGRIADFNPVEPHAPYEFRPEIAELHQSLFIGDWHADPTLWARDLSKRYDYGHVDIPRLLEGNFGLQTFTIVSQTPAGLNYDGNSSDAFDNMVPLSILQGWPPNTWFSQYQRTKYQMAKLRRYERRSKGAMRIIKGKSDFEALLDAQSNGEDVVGALIGIEGGHAFEGDLDKFQKLIDRGLLLIGLQHAFDNRLGGSLHGIEQGGLTEFGAEVIGMAKENGLIIDLAHSSHAVVKDVLRDHADAGPFVVSHTGIYSHCAINRNLPDDLMRAIAAQGGLVGIGFWEDVTCDASPKGVALAIRAAVNVLGEDHVSLGSDWDGTVPVSMDPSEIAALTQAMVDIGLSERVIRKVMGENMKALLLQKLK